MPNHLHGIVIIVGAKHSTKEFSKNLQYRQKNASPSLKLSKVRSFYLKLMKTFI